MADDAGRAGAEGVGRCHQFRHIAVGDRDVALQDQLGHGGVVALDHDPARAQVFKIFFVDGPGIIAIGKPRPGQRHEGSGCQTGHSRRNSLGHSVLLLVVDRLVRGALRDGVPFGLPLPCSPGAGWSVGRFRAVARQLAPSCRWVVDPVTGLASYTSGLCGADTIGSHKNINP